MKHQIGLTKTALLAIAQQRLADAQANVVFVGSLPDDIAMPSLKKPVASVGIHWTKLPKNKGKVRKMVAKLRAIRKAQLAKGNKIKTKTGKKYAKPGGAWELKARAKRQAEAKKVASAT